MGTLTPSQMFDHSLDVIKGPSLMHRLDYAAEPASGADIRAGAVCSLDSNGKLQAGCSAGAGANKPMPMFAIQDINDFDANSDVGNISGGVMSAIVATGGFEIETTEYVAEDTYNTNDFVTAANGAAIGKVAKMGEAPYGGQVAIGCVSKGVSVNSEGKSVIRFWTLFIPAGEAGDDNESSSSSSSESSESSASS